jgi:hypothetical protein
VAEAQVATLDVAATREKMHQASVVVVDQAVLLIRQHTEQVAEVELAYKVKGLAVTDTIHHGTAPDHPEAVATAGREAVVVTGVRTPGQAPAAQVSLTTSTVEHLVAVVVALARRGLHHLETVLAAV